MRFRQLEDSTAAAEELRRVKRSNQLWWIAFLAIWIELRNRNERDECQPTRTNDAGYVERRDVERRTAHYLFLYVHTQL